MKTKFIIPIIAATLAGCNIDSDSCPLITQVPFVSVDLPDSVEAGQAYTIDVSIYDYGCYNATKVVGEILDDTVYLEAYANYDECDCPPKSVNLEVTYQSKSDTSIRDFTLYYVYMLVNETKDSVRLCCDSVYFY